MENLRNYIKNNRNLFDEQEPLEGHSSRFEDLLRQTEEPKKRMAKKFKIIAMFSIAASIAVLIVIAPTFFAPRLIQRNANVENTLSDEFRSTNEYFRQQMEEQIAQIMCKLAYTEPENQARLSEDLQKIINDNTVFIDEIVQDENEELAIHFLVKHYKLNIQALENINEKLGKYTKC